MPTRSVTAIHGSILGTIIGDAIGLPYEALSRRLGQRLLGPADRHRFLFGHGMMSDDGEHTCMVAQALCDSGGDVERFRKALARRLRWWLLGMPAGIGGATLRSILKLWIGFSPLRSGVFSAGNGPAMRSAILGVTIDDPDQLRDFVLASTRITHTDPKAFHGAMAVALAAQCSKQDEPGSTYIDRVRNALAHDNADELFELLQRAVHSAASGASALAFAASIGCEKGVSGYVYATVPVAIHAWLRHPTSYADAITDAIACGGDTDTVAAIAGGIVGARCGVEGIPIAWRTGLLEWPRNQKWIFSLANAVTTSSEHPIAPPNVGLSVLLRNLLFILVVFAHIARRAFPPY